MKTPSWLTTYSFWVPAKCHHLIKDTERLYSLVITRTKTFQTYYLATHMTDKPNYSSHRQVNFGEHCAMSLTLFCHLNGERQGKTNTSGTGKKTEVFWHDVTLQQRWNNDNKLLPTATWVALFWGRNLSAVENTWWRSSHQMWSMEKPDTRWQRAFLDIKSQLPPIISGVGLFHFILPHWDGTEPCTHEAHDHSQHCLANLRVITHFLKCHTVHSAAEKE